MMKKFLKILLFLALAFNISFANEEDNLKKEFLNKIDEIIFIIKDKTINKEQRNDSIVKALTPMFDFELMAKLSLGKTWKTLDSINQVEFVKLYVKRMKNSYSSKLDSYSDEKIEIKGVTSPKKNRIEINTDLVSEKNNFEVVYKFYKTNKKIENKNDWLIYDVEISGVSILKTDIAQFREFLQNKTIQELMESLKQQI